MPKSVTYVSGINCHPSIRKGTEHLFLSVWTPLWTPYAVALKSKGAVERMWHHSRPLAQLAEYTHQGLRAPEMG